MSATAVADHRERESRAGPCAVLLQLLQELQRHDLAYCVLRGGDRLPEQVADGEVDLLVDPSRLEEFRRLAGEHGFASLNRWGHAPHRFFVGYDRESDGWLKLDVVTAIAYGRPAHALGTDLAEECLEHRRREGDVFVPSAELELVTLLLHCLIDKGAFPPEWAARLKRLCGEVEDGSRVSRLLAEYWSPAMSWKRLRSLVEVGRWDVLLADREKVAGRLAGRAPLGSLLRRGRDRFLRKAQRLWWRLRPEALSVALLAPDGAGKSTLADELARTFYFPISCIYMGLYPQGVQSARRKLPGLGLMKNLLTQWSRYLSARGQRARGRFVVFDRYPYDTLLPSMRPLGRLRRWRRRLLGRACPAPDLVVVLDAPGEVLYARKREHSPEHLEQQRQAYAALARRLPNAVVIDAAADPERVRIDVAAHIWQRFVGVIDS